VTSVAKSSFDGIKVELVSKGSDVSVVIRCVVGIKEADVVLQVKPSDDLYNSLCNISTYMLAFLL
jgi:hypothetical protein